MSIQTITNGVNGYRPEYAIMMMETLYNPVERVSDMLQERGFQFDHYVMGMRKSAVLIGDFNRNVNCKIMVGPNFNLTGLILSIYLPKRLQWKELKEEYNSYKDILMKNRELTLSSTKEEFKYPHYEGDGNELLCLRNDRCEYISYFSNNKRNAAFESESIMLSINDGQGSVLDAVSGQVCVSMKGHSSKNVIILFDMLNKSLGFDIKPQISSKTNTPSSDVISPIDSLLEASKAADKNYHSSDSIFEETKAIIADMYRSLVELEYCNGVLYKLSSFVSPIVSQFKLSINSQVAFTAISDVLHCYKSMGVDIYGKDNIGVILLILKLLPISIELDGYSQSIIKSAFEEKVLTFVRMIDRGTPHSDIQSFFYESLKKAGVDSHLSTFLKSLYNLSLVLNKLSYCQTDEGLYYSEYLLNAIFSLECNET